MKKIIISLVVIFAAATIMSAQSVQEATELAKAAKAALAEGLKVILCLGEVKEQRLAGIRLISEMEEEFTPEQTEEQTQVG